MGSALKIRDDLTPLELRRWARVESYGRAAARAYGIANALEEMPRADAARLAGMDRQTLRDAVVRYNAKGLEGLHDRPKGYSPRRLTADEEAALAAVIIAGPEPERDGVCAWTRADLCRWLEERFAKTYHLCLPFISSGVHQARVSGSRDRSKRTASAGDTLVVHRLLPAIPHAPGARQGYP